MTARDGPRDESELAHARHLLREREQLFHKMLAVIPDMVAVIDRDLNLLYCNWNSFAAVAPDRRIVPSKCYETLRGLEGRCPDCRAYEVFETGRPLHAQVDLPEGLCIDLQVLPIHDDDGDVDLVVEWVRDVTEMKRFELAQRRSDARFRALVESSSDLVWEVDRDGRYVYVSPRVESILGRHPDEVLGRTPFDFMPPEQADRLRALFAEQVGAETPIVALENTAVRPDGRRVILETSGVPVRDDAGRLVGYRGIDRDITERKRSEEELRRSEQRLAFALAATNDGLWDWNISTGSAYFSPRYYTMLGYAPDELPATYATWSSLLHPDDVAPTEATIREHLEGRTANYVVEFRMRTRDGGWRWILGRGRVVERDEQGRPVRMAGTHTDVTERKQADEERAKLQEQLTQAQKMESIGRLAGGVAHDFNNLLTGISGNVSLALMDLSENDPLRETLDEIGQAADSAASLTRQLLAFSRKQLVEPRVLDLNDVFEGSHRMLRRMIGEDIDLVFLPQRGLGYVKIDPGQVEQILVNLVVNARDAMPNGGKLTLETANVTFDARESRARDLRTPGEFVMFAVSDDGVGMDAEVRAHLFEPFFTTKEKGKGTGLGLATVYGAVKQNQGAVQVYSELGAGTTVRVYLPRVEAKVERVTRRGDGDLPGGTETVIVVEDDPMVRNLAVRVLRRLGYEVHACANGGEALMFVEGLTTPFHLLMTDVIMPGINGKVLADNIRRLRPEVRVLFTSGYTENAIAHHGVLDPGIEFIGKPYSPLALARKVRDVLDR